VGRDRDVPMPVQQRGQDAERLHERARGPATVEQLRALQRSAGNQATVAALRARADTGPQLMRMTFKKWMVGEQQAVNAIVGGTDVDTTTLTAEQRSQLLVVLEADTKFSRDRGALLDALRLEVEADRRQAPGAQSPAPTVSEPTSPPRVVPEVRAPVAFSAAAMNLAVMPQGARQRTRAPAPAIDATPAVPVQPSQPAADPALKPADAGQRDVLPAQTPYASADGETSYDALTRDEQVTVVTRSSAESRSVLLAGAERERADGSRAFVGSAEDREVELIRRARQSRLRSGAHFWTTGSADAQSLTEAQSVTSVRNVTETRWTLRAGAPTVDAKDGGAFVPKDFEREVDLVVTGDGFYHFRTRGGTTLMKTASANITSTQVQMVAFRTRGYADECRAAAADVTTADTQVFRLRGGTDEMCAPDSVIRTTNAAYDVFHRGAPAERFRVPSGRLQQRSAGFQALPQRLERTEDLFPPGSPLAAEIEQTGLGDCYLQAVLIEIAQRDPGHLRSIMIGAGDMVTVRLHHQASAQGAFTPEDVTVQASLPTTATGGALYNAGAVWARLMQKAFAVFAERHGQYGTAYAPYQPARRGYDGIESGVSNQLYQVFYGPRVSGHSRTEMGYDPARPDLGASLGAVNRLSAFATPSSDRLTFLTSSADIAGQVRRALAHVNRVRLGSDQGRLEAFGAALVTAQGELASVAAERAATLPSVQAVKRQAAAMATLLESYSGGGVTELRELCLDLSQIGSDSGSERRFIYSSHAYAIVGVTMRMLGNVPTPATFTQEQLAQLDVQASRVALRNPHRENVPTGLEQDGDEGRFELSLAQFFRNYTTLDEGVVERR
jgi:hypothetical protein